MNLNKNTIYFGVLAIDGKKTRYISLKIMTSNCRHTQGRGKVFYVGGAVCVCGGGSQFLRINITPNRNRKSCYILRTFMRSC